MRADADCLLCRPADANRHFHRREVWGDELWRLSVVVEGSPIRGFSHLEPRRHIPHITDLDGREATTLGPVLAMVTAALKAETGADLVHVHIFGERVAHLHLNLAPHMAGDPLLGGPGLVRPGSPELDPAELSATAERLRALLGR